MSFDWWFVFTPFGLSIAALGAALGIIWGALPGLSSNMAMALLVGFTYSLSAPVAIVFLISVWVATEFGGAISAVLVNIPGTPSAVPTAMAGYPLARRGQGGLAIGTALTFSMLGNWAGLFVLVALAPVMIAIALSFSSWEIFLLVMLGVSIAGTLTGREEPLKGWAMGWFGLMIAMVGMDQIHGVARFTFDVPELMAGIKYLPVLIGLFGLTETLNVLSRRTPIPIPSKVGRIVPPLSFIGKYWKSALRSSAVGTVIGAIPGVGANIAAFVSYNFGERATGRKFTNGDFEGVVCSEVANNACCGGALLPTTTLGIPGNSSCALIIAALSLHGITLGPNINMDHPGFMHFIYATLFSSNLFMYAVAFMLIRPSVYLLSLPPAIVMSAVILLCLIGTFAASDSMFDIGVMFISGGIGYLLYRGSYPFAPLILGLILGPLADQNLRRTIWIYDGKYQDLLMRPVGLILLVAVIWSFYYGIRRSLEEGAKIKREATQKATQSKAAAKQSARH
jgi:putative tricarboxylic transport membrane protein